MMKIEIIEQPIRFHLLGLSAARGNRSYGEAGCRLMDEMWKIVKDARLSTTGICYWVYFADDQMFVGVAVRDIEQSAIPEQLETCDLQLARHSKYLHVGPYHDLPQKWRALKDELSDRGETVTMPSIEVYGHSCEGADESVAETTILLGLKPRER